MQNTPIIVISGAIGSGKGTLIYALVHDLSLTWVPTHTTRPIRRDDQLLSHHIFDTDATFERAIERNEFIEYDEIADQRYGLLRADLEHALKTSRGVILELSVTGGQALAKVYPHALLIFVTASGESRRERIGHRHMDPTEMKLRMAESAAEEKTAHTAYDYIIENPDHHPHLAIRDIRDLIADHFPELDQ